jgi:hypothetical protein
MDIHTAETLVPEPSLVEVEIAIGQIPTELIKAGDEILHIEVNKFIFSLWN